MKKEAHKHIAHRRVTVGGFASSPDDGNNGCFAIPFGMRMLNVIASSGDGWSESGLPGKPWEHVSVSLHDRCPTWEEMDFVKQLFWSDDETVIQLHVPAGDHINNHPYCLHLWKPLGVEIPRPPSLTVGIPELN